MALGYMPVVAVLIAEIVIGAALVMGIYRFMEYNVALGAAGGVLFGVGVVYAEWQVGEIVFDLTLGELKLLVVVGAIGAVVGVVGTVLTVQPEL